MTAAAWGGSRDSPRTTVARWRVRLTRTNATASRTGITSVSTIGEYNFRSGTHAVTKGTRPVFSYDDRTWAHFADSDVSWDELDIRLTLGARPERSTMWIAHMTPYTSRELKRLLSIKSPYLKPETIGKSAKGRKLLLLTVTDPATPTKASELCG